VLAHYAFRIGFSVEQAPEKQVSRSHRPLYVLLLLLILLKMVTYITLKSSPFSGVYKPVEFWQLEDQTPQQTKRHHGSSVFTLKEMEEATNSFSEENLLGKGGFGRVYRGTLRSREVCSESLFLNISY
jgi:hypothetical protein